MTQTPTDLRSFTALLEIVASLRGPNGCPWDKEQTHQSLTPFAIEEVFEFIETVDRQDDSAMKEELGDVLFQVALHAQLAKERNAFTIEDVLAELNTKMVRRHPHVFGNETAATSQEVLENWEAIKKKEKLHKKTHEYFDIPAALPALQRSFKIGKKTQKTGFDWSHPNEVKTKIFEELAEVDGAILSKNNDLIANELGDLLFSVAQYVRHLNHEPESCLRLANRKFERRYFAMQELCRLKGVEFETLTSTEKEELWNKVKTEGEK
jgi:tetrapyrrole methylase family protein/MazG family protein